MYSKNEASNQARALAATARCVLQHKPSIPHKRTQGENRPFLAAHFSCYTTLPWQSSRTAVPMFKASSASVHGPSACTLNPNTLGTYVDVFGVVLSSGHPSSKRWGSVVPQKAPSLARTYPDGT